MLNKTEITEQVHAEITRQDGLWGADRVHHPLQWLAILHEETGEVAKEIVNWEFAFDPNVSPQDYHKLPQMQNMRKELIQVAAVAMQFVNSIDLKLESLKE